jgi:hypothetical protein
MKKNIYKLIRFENICMYLYLMYLSIYLLMLIAYIIINKYIKTALSQFQHINISSNYYSLKANI